MQKRGQVSVFIILGIILLALGIFILKLQSTNETAQLKQNPLSATSIERPAVEEFVNSCLQSTTKIALHTIARQGGYYKLPPNSDLGNNVPIYINNSVVYIPTIEKIEEQISTAITKLLPECLGEFKTFEKQGIEIHVSTISTKSKLKQDKVSINLYMPMTISSATVTEITDFAINQETGLLGLYHSAISFTQSQAELENEVCLTCLLELGDIETFYPTILEIAPNRYLYVLKNDNENLSFMFDHDYNQVTHPP